MLSDPAVERGLLFVYTARRKVNPREATMKTFLSAALLCLTLLSPTVTHAKTQDTVVFVGSSSIANWSSLQRDFPAVHVVNGGTRGSKLADATLNVERLVIQYKPHTVVLYAGDNDVNVGTSPATIYADFKVFVATVHAALPKTRIVYIAIKPSPSRWHLKNNIVATNTLIAEECAKNERLQFADVYSLMLTPQGEPDTAFFQDDKLHLNDAGYAIWRRELAPFLN